MGKNTQSKTVLITREFSSGGVVFKKDGQNTLWLIRKTSPSDLFPETHWMLPKGWLDDEDSGVPGPMASGKVKADENILRDTAIREVAEEGGVEAKVVKKIETLKYFYSHPARGKILKFVTFFLMEWQKDLPDGFDGETSEIRWLPFEQAYKTLSFSLEKKILEKANQMLTESSLV